MGSRVENIKKLYLDNLMNQMHIEELRYNLDRVVYFLIDSKKTFKAEELKEFGDTNGILKLRQDKIKNIQELIKAEHDNVGSCQKRRFDSLIKKAKIENDLNRLLLLRAEENSTADDEIRKSIQRHIDFNEKEIERLKQIKEFCVNL